MKLADIVTISTPRLKEKLLNIPTERQRLLAMALIFKDTIKKELIPIMKKSTLFLLMEIMLN